MFRRLVCSHLFLFLLTSYPISTSLLSCGHTCPSKCHQISDHSKMPCEAVVYGKCPIGHPSSRKCKEPQKPCAKCEAIRKAAERKAKTDLEHARAIADLDMQIERERAAVRQAHDAEVKANPLAQKQNDLITTKESAKIAASEPSVSDRNPASNFPVSLAKYPSPIDKVLSPTGSQFEGDGSDSARARWSSRRRPTMNRTTRTTR